MRVYYNASNMAAYGTRILYTIFKKNNVSQFWEQNKYIKMAYWPLLSTKMVSTKPSITTFTKQTYTNPFVQCVHFCQNIYISIDTMLYGSELIHNYISMYIYLYEGYSKIASNKSYGASKSYTSQ